MEAHKTTLEREVGTPEHFEWLRGVLIAVLILNVIDATLTTLWISSGIAVESNPLMDSALTVGWVPFAMTKISLVSLGSYLLWRQRRHRLAVVGIFVAFLGYYAVLVQHVSGFTDLVLFDLPTLPVESVPDRAPTAPV